jgi:hypothetical protein
MRKHFGNSDTDWRPEYEAVELKHTMKIGIQKIIKVCI